MSFVIDEVQLRFALMGVIAVCTASFFLGLAVSESRERLAHRRTQKALAQIADRERNLARWVQKNWPSEWKAYYLGHAEGYQQGVLQAAEMEARAEAENDPAS